MAVRLITAVNQLTDNGSQTTESEQKTAYYIAEPNEREVDLAN